MKTIGCESNVLMSIFPFSDLTEIILLCFDLFWLCFVLGLVCLVFCFGFWRGGGFVLTGNLIYFSALRIYTSVCQTRQKW